MAVGEQVPGDILPQNIEAEQALLGALVLDPRAHDRVASLRPEDFYLPAHQTVFAGMRTVLERGEEPELVTLADALGARGQLDAVGGEAYLVSLATMTPTSVNVEHYARIVARLAHLRRIVEAGVQIQAVGCDQRLSAAAATARVEEIVLGLARRDGAAAAFEPLGTVLARVVDAIDQRGEAGLRGHATGLSDLDRLSGGLQADDLVVLAGRTSSGKTALSLNVALHVARITRLPVAIFSIEMGADPLAERFLALQSRLSAHRLRSGRLSDGDWERIVRAAGELAGLPIPINADPGVLPMEMLAHSRRLQAEHGLALVVVDYLQLMHGLRENRVQEVGLLVGQLKLMARTLHVPVLALSQLSRAPDQRSDHEPTLSDLRETGAIEHVADQVWLLYREGLFDAQVPPNETKLIVAKNRQGPRGTVDLWFEEEAMAFGQVEHRAVADTTPRGEAEAERGNWWDR